MTWLKELIKLEKGNLSRIKKTNWKQLDLVTVDFWKLTHLSEHGVGENTEEHNYFVSYTVGLLDSVSTFLHLLENNIYRSCAMPYFSAKLFIQKTPYETYECDKSKMMNDFYLVF